MTTDKRIQKALESARKNDANNRDAARRLPGPSASGAGASGDRAQQALAAARQKDKTTTRTLTPSRTPSSTPASPLPSFATGSGNTVESVLGRFSGRGGVEAIKSPDSWSSAGDAELGLKAWSGQLDGYEKKLTELSGDIANTENRLKSLQTTVKTAEDAAAYDELYAGYERMIADYNGVVNDINRVQDKYSAGVERYRDILSGGMERADAAATEAKRLEDENSRLQRQANLIRIYEMSGTSPSSAAAPIEAQIEQNAQRIKELRAEESQNKMQYYSSLALMEDYAGLSSPASVTDDTRYEYINDIDNARYRNEHTTDPSGAPVALRRYQYLTEDEIKIYNYLYASQGKEAADRFLEDMGPALTERQGTAQYEKLGALGKALYWIPAGLDQFGSGIRQLFQREAVPVSSTQITSQLIQQEAQEKSPVLGTLYTLGTTLSNMAPSILASALGSWALGAAGLSAGTAAAVGRATGAATLGASAGGNAYTQKLNEGYSSEAAQNYATLVGASEGALQYLLGGIGALSKSGTGRIAAKIAGLDNALGRVARTVSGSTAARLLGSMISEGTEEGLQELLEPAFAAIIFDEEYEADFEDAAYAFLLGALSAGIIEGPAAIAYARRPAGFSFRDMDGYADNGVDYFEGANTLEEVEALYRDLARQYHPDLGGDAATMAEINRQRTMARAFFRGRAEVAAADEAADTTPEAAANTERADGVIRRLTAGRTTEETTPETAGAQIEDQIYAEAGGIVLPTADTAGDFSPRVEVGATETSTLEAPRAAAPETNAAGNIVLPTADEIMNGGIQNGQQGQQWQQWGDQVSDGDGGRLDGISTGGQAGRLGGSAEVRSAPAEQGRAAIERQNRARDLRLQEVSSAELGIPEGTDTRNVRVLPETDWDDELVSTAERVRSVTGREVRYVLGSIEVRTAGGGTHRVRGVWMPNGDIIVQADNMRVSAQQIAEHEIYHDIAAQMPGTDYEVEERIREQFGAEEFERVVEIYIQKLHGIVDLPANASEGEFETALARIKQEIFADAYAGINAFGAHAERFADPTRETVKERTGIRSRENDDATRDRTGPPAERYSYAGTNAANADLEALEVAKGMAEQNVSAETIRQATGWFQGADGKWRFEIDDSGMRYSARGDLNYGDPDYWRYRELRDKLERDMLGIGSEAVTEADRAEYEADRARVINSIEGARFSTDEDDDRPVEQAISSAKTSLRQVPALFKDKNVQFGDVNIDIGGGKYDLATEFLAERGTQNLVFDPYNRGEATNRATLDFLRDGSRADTATNANVLNVIAEAPARANVILEMAKAIKPDGKAYFMVYEGDGSGVGRETSAGWQNNRKTADYMDEIKRYFDSVERRGKLIIASNPKADLPKALWEVQPGDAVRYSAADDEPRPVIAKQDLRRRLLDTFSVPPGSRAELGRIIEGFADKMIRSGRYTEQNRSALFDKLYDAGAMTLTADPYYSDARGALVKRRMYVSDALKAEFGDDWNDFRKRAFAAGIYLTNNSNDMAPDMWQAELGETLPGLFDADNLDMRSFMERVVQVAEEGRDEQVSLAEYTQMLAGENYVSEDEVLQDLEQRVDWELRSFAEKADLEVRLRGRGADGISNTERKRIIQEERANYWQLHKQYQEETRRRIAEERQKRHASEKEAREKIDNIIREEREKHWQKRREYQQRADERVRQEREKRWAAQAETRQRIDDVEQAERRTYYERLERYKEGRRATDARERERRKAMSERRRETAELRNLQQRTLKQIQWLAKNQYRAPAELKQQWDEVLGDLDIFAVSAANEMNYSKKYDATWRDLAEMYKKARDTDPNFLPSQELERIVARLDNDKIGDLDIGALQDLYKAAVGLRQEFYNRNHVIGDEEARLFSELYADSKEEINSAPGGYSKNPADKVFNLEQLTPMNYLERMAGWNPDSAWYSMAKQLEAGERNERAYIVQANALLADWLEENEEWVLRSDGQGKDAVWYEIEVPELLELGMGDKPVFGDSIKVWMTPSMKVHLYLESKNYDNLRHMVGGRTFPDKELYSEGKRQEAFAQGKTVRLAPETVKKLVSDLTPEERELAAMLERYYNQFAAERINKVSNALYGYDRAVTTNYAPIYTNSNYNQKEIGKFDQTAEGVGNLKQRIRGAKNPSYNLSAYDAFERHVDQTARFVGMAIPARNWKTLLNWRERDNSMSDVITHKWGSESLKYITDLLTDLQGGSPRKAQFQISSFADRLWSNYISAVFGANPSIVLKQLGSIPLGGAYLGMENVPTPRQMANIDRDLIALYTSELDWRLMGYATPETKQLKDHPNWTQRNSFFRNVFGGGAITGVDGWAASTLWPWAENKVRREQPELEVGTQEQIDAGQSPFYKAVAAEFDNAVNRSQSMSDTLHNARIRKSDHAVLRTLTMFKSDAAQTYNAFRQTIGEAQYYKRTGASSKTQRTARAAMGAAFLAWIVNAAWTAGVNFLVNLAKTKGKNYRDDEDKLTAQSVLGNMASDMLNGMSGVVILGEELAGAIGSAITGERWYGLDVPGVEQLNDILESIISSDKNTILIEAVNIGRQGGDVIAYLNEHRADLIGEIKDVAMTAATYLGGISANNVEAYLLGILNWTLPGIATAYEDMFETPDKASLSGLEGDALVTRVEDILASRLEDVSEPAAQTVATLYAAGYTEALPSGIPKQVTVTDKKTDTSETVELDAYQQQFFGQVWTETVGRAVDELVLMPEFEAASPEDQAKMLSQIYRFANETAKAETVEKYSPPSTMAEAAEDIASGRTLAEWAAYDVLSDDVSGTFGKLTDEGLDYEQALDVAETLDDLGDDATSVERYLAVARMPIPEDEKELALRGVMTDSAYAKYETARNAGIDTLDYCEFLDRISDISGDSRQERVWALIDSMRLTNRQKDVLHLAAGYKDSTLSKTPWHN